ncbi:hypothetical protein Noda2021_09530 [Candidatus Dependentiae bacterium Noda2021]|nr:hypothetical protein Noda2021_09530 [Candidatus Dependentiae bacterium Noda2021]
MKQKKFIYYFLTTISLFTSTTNCWSPFKKIVEYVNYISLGNLHETNRKWLNLVYMANPDILTQPAVTSNVDYFHSLVATHHQRLLNKSKTSENIKRTKRILIASTSAATIFWFSFVVWIELTLLKTNDQSLMFPSMIGTGYMLYSFLATLNYLKSYQLYDIKQAHHLRRDQHMLKQLEEYNATHKH